jgi:hypothetical protein
MTLTYCKVDHRFSRFKKICELFLGIEFSDDPYDRELNPDLTKVTAVIPDKIVTATRYRCHDLKDDDPEFVKKLQDFVRNFIDAASWLAECMHIEEGDTRLAIIKMHQMAETYEDAAFKLRREGKIHDMHGAMSNAKSLRSAANLIDGTCCNGG